MDLESFVIIIFSFFKVKKNVVFLDKHLCEINFSYFTLVFYDKNQGSCVCVYIYIYIYIYIYSSDGLVPSCDCMCVDTWVMLMRYDDAI